MVIRVSPLTALIALWFGRFVPSFLVMCRGYSDDDVNFTELIWEDDKNMGFFDRETYPEFQIWSKSV